MVKNDKDALESQIKRREEFIKQKQKKVYETALTNADHMYKESKALIKKVNLPQTFSHLFCRASTKRPSIK